MRTEIKYKDSNCQIEFTMFYKEPKELKAFEKFINTQENMQALLSLSGIN